jgi:hypothetical protein
MGDEAEALESQYDGYIVEAEDFVREVHHELRRDAVIYAANKKKKVGEKCICAGPMCSKAFIKKTHQQAFHRNKCKDQFWNRVRFWKDEIKVEMLVEKIDEMNHGERDW